MRYFLVKFAYLFALLVFSNCSRTIADNLLLNSNINKKNEISIESKIQRSNLKESIFYAEGDVVITNLNNEFIAKSKEAIFYKLGGKIKLIGDVEVITKDSNTIRAGEVIYHVKENKFEAISGLKKRVTTSFVLDENELFKESPEK